MIMHSTATITDTNHGRATTYKTGKNTFLGSSSSIGNHNVKPCRIIL